MEASENGTSRTMKVGNAAVSVIRAVEPEVCVEILEVLNRHLQETCQGWTKARHDLYPTTDIPLSEIPELYELWETTLEETILPQIIDLYSERDEIVASDLFIVKYCADEGEQRALALHQDDSAYSFNLLLSDPSTDFRGGGTYFDKPFDRIVAIERGTSLSNPSKPL